MNDPQQPQQQLSALLAILSDTTSISEPPDLARHVLDHVIATTLADSGGIWLREDTGVTCLAQQGLDVYFHDPLSPQPPAVDSSLQRVIATGRAEFMDIPLADTIDDLGHERLHTLAILPLVAGGTPIGALALASPDGIAALPEVQKLLHAVAAHLALAFRNALLAQQIEHQRQQFETEERQRDEFLSIASHELKNPLASIKGYADLILRRLAKQPDDPNRKGLEIISQQVTRTTMLIEQISDIARVGMGRLQLERYQTNLSAIVRRLVKDAQENAEQHQISLDIAEQTLVGMFDEQRIGQAIGQLLGNALKFSPDGGPIEVHVARAAGAQGAEAIISVKDYGIGIPAEEHDRIGERFFRASNAGSTFAGMGVGLFIARAVVQQHGGRMWFESARQAGTTFYLALPLK